MSTEELLHRLAPGMHIDTFLPSTGKAVLAVGSYNGQPAIAKHLVDTTPLWTSHFARETAALDTFTHSPPPIGAPRILAAWPDQFLMIMEHLDGTPFSADRHPSGPLDTNLRNRLLEHLEALPTWAGATAGYPWNQAVDYTERITKYTHTHQILTHQDAHHLTRLYETVGNDRHPAHGDLIAPNVLISHAVPRLIDWEYAGSYLPGYDHALLWVTATRDAATRTAIEERVGTNRRRYQAFLVNTLLLLAREVRMHQPHRQEPWAAGRLDQLHRDLSHTRALLDSHQ